MAELAAFEDGGGERDVGGLVEVCAAAEHTGRDREEGFFSAEAVKDAVDGAGEIFGAELAFPLIGRSGNFAGVEGEESFFAEGREQCLAREGFEKAVGNGGKALLVIAGGDAERAFGSHEEVGLRRRMRRPREPAVPPQMRG